MIVGGLGADFWIWPGRIGVTTKAHPRVPQNVLGSLFRNLGLTARPEARDGRIVNALPPLKVVQLLGNACLSPTTLAPKDPFRSCVETALHELFSLFSEEPHRVTSNDLVGALGAGPRPEGVGRPAAWFAPSHDVTTRLMFSSGADSFSPANRPNIPITKEPITSYQGPALFQGSFTKIITRLITPPGRLNGTG